jgi:peroxiredoxin
MKSHLTGRLLLMLTMLAIALVSQLSSIGASAEIMRAAARKNAPDFTLEQADGTPVTLSAFKGRVVLLDLWATWCTGCKTEIPWFIEFDWKYRNRGLTTIGAAMDEDGWTAVRPYIAQHSISYPIVLGYPTLMEPYRVTVLPVTMLIDKEGNIADVHAGIVDKARWESEIRVLLQEPHRREAR